MTGAKLIGSKQTYCRPRAKYFRGNETSSEAQSDPQRELKRLKDFDEMGPLP